MRSGMKQMPIGIDSFKKLIERNSYYVDKTLFIKEIVNSISEVILFTRPRRFGKTLNFSMLKCFLEIPECRVNDNENKDYSYLFDGLQISENKEFVNEHFGKYPVISFSFKKIKSTRFELAYEDFTKEISREYVRHRYLLDAGVMLDFEKEKYMNIMTLKASQSDYTDAIYDLSGYLKKYFKKGTIVLLDEYDTPLHYAKLNGYYAEMLDIIRAFMLDGLKGNDNIEKGIVTGIMKISQESIFSAFNNPKIATLTSGYCADSFGFTEEEVKKIIKYYRFEQYSDIIREWYNGYLFGGNTVIYNPWSIISFIDSNDHVPKAYWVNTGDTGLIKKCLQLDRTKGKEYVERLYKGESIELEVEQNIVYEDVLNNVDKALSYLLHAGYLKALRVEGKGDSFLLSIPNRELHQIYKSILKNWFEAEQKTGSINAELIKSLLSGNMQDFEIHLQDILLSSSSFYDAAGSGISRSETGIEKEKYENFYHGLILGIMVNLSDSYYIESNREYGLGRPDIVIIPKDLSKKAFVLELKNEYTASKKSAEDAAKEALQQISDRRYEEGVKTKGVEEVVKIGLGFKGKELKVVL